jgi:L-asparaginase
MAQIDSILILTTGGTIDKQYFDALSRYQITGTTVVKLLNIGCVIHPYDVEELLRKDSIELTDDDRATLVQHARLASQARIVVTHGTDTMTLSASALSVIPDKTIVLVGALSPSRFAESDAAFNLGMAFAAAQTAPAGIYITMNGFVFPAGEVIKDREKGCFVRKTAAEEP